MKKSSGINKKVASVALSSMMVLSNTSYGTIDISAEEHDGEIQIGDESDLTSSSGIGVTDVVTVTPEVVVPPAVVIPPAVVVPPVTVIPVVPKVETIKTTSGSAVKIEPTVAGNVTSDPGYNWTFSQAGGKFDTPSTAGFLAFPQVAGNWTIELDVTVTRAGADNLYGVFVGALSGADGTTPEYYAGMGARNTDQLIGLYHKADKTTGALQWGSSAFTQAPTFELNKKAPMKVQKTDSGLTITTTGKDGVEVTKSMGYSNFYTQGITKDNPSRPGLVFANVDCTITNLTYSVAGEVKYSQASEYAAAGTAPIVKSVTASETKGVISASWVDETAGTGDGFGYNVGLYDGNDTLVEQVYVAGTAEKTATFKVRTSGDYKVKVSGVINETPTTVVSSNVVSVVIEVLSYIPRVWDPSEKLEASTESRLMTFSQKNEGAAFTNSASTSYLMFPSTDEYYTMNLDLVMKTVGTGNNYKGVFVGLFGGDNGATPTAVAGVGFRSTNNIRGLYTKTSGEFMGAGGLDFNFKDNERIPVTVTKSAAGVTIKAGGYNVDWVPVTQEYTLSYGNLSGITATSSERMGIQFSGVDATIANIVVTGGNGVVYSQKATFPATGTAPIVSSVAKPTTNELKTEITTSWQASTEAVGDGAYKVELSSDNGATYKVINPETTEKSITVPTSVEGNYKFKITGILGEATTTPAYSESVYVLPALNRTTVEVAGKDKAIDLSYGAVANATYYKIYRRSADESEFTLIADNYTELSYTDTNVTNEMPYYYYVQAMNATNVGLLSKTVFALPTAGHIGEYVYEDEACKIEITEKSSDTLLTNTAKLKGTVDRTGTLDLFVNGEKVNTTTDSAFDFNFEVVEGRNDVNLIFTDSEGKKTRQTYNFVYLTNYNIVVDPAFSGVDGSVYELNNEAFVYSTIQAAINSVSSTNSKRVVIFVKNGKYAEHLEITSPNITLIGEDRDNTVVQYATTNVGDMTNRAAVRVRSTATNFTAENICFENTFDYPSIRDGQADAVRIDADNTIFVNTKLVGYQDTLCANQGKQYFYKCRIEGLVDFIYGNYAQAVFEDCDIVFKFVAGKTTGHVTAPKHTGIKDYGYTFNNCRILAEEGCEGAAYDLGRPWEASAFVVFMNTYMTKVIADGPGWANWSGGATADEARFYEYGSYGPGFEVTQAREQLSPTKANGMLDISLLGWDPYTATAKLSESYVYVQTDEATVTSVSPERATLESVGGMHTVTVIGKNLLDSGISLTDGTATITPFELTNNVAKFEIEIGDNESTRESVVHTFTVMFGETATNYKSVVTVLPLKNYEFNLGYVGSSSANGTVTDEGGVITITPGNGKIDSSSTDNYPFYNFEVNDSDSFTLEVDMTTTGVATSGTVSTQSYAGILYRDFISASAAERPAMIGTGVKGATASTVATQSFYRDVYNYADIPVLDITVTGTEEAITSGNTHKLRFDKYGNTIRMSVDGKVTINETVVPAFNYENDGTSNIGLFAVRNLITKFENVVYTSYKNGNLVATTPNKTTYVQNFESEFDTTGLKVTLDGKEVSLDECIITGFDVSTVGTKTIQIAYGADVATVNINVVAPAISGLKVLYAPVKDTYFTGQTLELNGLQLKATYNNNPNFTKTFTYGNQEFDELFAASALDTTKVAGIKPVDIYVKNNSSVKTSFNVEVKLYALSRLEIVLPAKTEYYVGDGDGSAINLDTKGMAVKSVYVSADGKNTYYERLELNDSNLTIAKVNTTQVSQNQKIAVTYKGVTQYINVNVVAVKPVRAEISSYPQTTYNLKETFDANGLVVKVINNNGTESVLTNGTDYVVDLSNVDTATAGTYVANVNVTNLDIAQKVIPFNLTYRNVFVPNWQSVIFGQSTSLSSNNGQDCVVTPNGDVLNGGSVRVASINGKGKVTGAQDGISYYYFELDPSADNFKISADILVNSYTKDTSAPVQSHDGQESFGIMVRDANNTHGDSSSFAANVAAVGGYAGATTALNGIQGFVRSGVDPSDSSSVIGMQVERLTTERAYKMVGKTYNLSLEKDNTGFLMAVDGGTPVRIYSDIDLLAKQNGEKMYVGFYAARVADINVSNVSLKVTDAASDAPQQFKPVAPKEPVITVGSLDKFGMTNYDFKFTPSVNGIVKVKLGSTVIADELAVVGGKQVIIPTTLNVGENNFAVEFWPDSTQNITSSSKVLTQYTVTQRTLGSNSIVYASNNGVSTNDGTINSPVDVQTALSYAVKGQTIYLAGGTYNLTSELVAPKDVNGAYGQEICVRPLDEDSDVIFDFNNVGAGLRVSGDYWHFFKINVTRSAANSNALVIAGNHNILESSNAYRNGNTGIQIAALSGSAPRSTWPSYNTVINCSSFENRDPSANNADGFTAKITNGAGNKFIGCISYANADDGWDLYSKTESGAIEPVTLINCVAYGNGYIDGKLTGGDMNGFKLGGEGLPVNHTIINSLAFNNGAHGFDSNSNPNVVARGNVSYNNEGSNFNMVTYANNTPKFQVKDFVSYYTADYTSKTKDNYTQTQVPLTDTYNETTYLHNGSKSQNSAGVEFTAENFDALVVPTEIVRSADVFGSTKSNVVFGNLWTNFNAFFGNEEVVETEATITSISPNGVKNITSAGGRVEITVTGTGLTDENIRLINGSNQVLPMTISDTVATFAVILPENKSDEAISYTCVVGLNNKLTNYSVKFVVSGVVTEEVIEDDNDDSQEDTVVVDKENNQDGESTIIETVEDGIASIIISTVEDLVIKDINIGIKGSDIKNENKEVKVETVISAVKVAEEIIDKITAYSEKNAALLEKTAITIVTTVKTEDKATKEVTEQVVTKAVEDVYLSYNLKDIEMTEKEQKDLIAVRINPDGTTSYLGGKYNPVTGEFKAATKDLNGTFAVIIADPSLYNQVELKIGSKEVSKNRETATLDTPPVIVNDTTFVPVRFITESLGAKVSYQASTKTAIIEIDGKVVSFTVGQDKEGQKAPFIENNRMLIPIRNISESFGANVIWDSAEKSIQITK